MDDKTKESIINAAFHNNILLNPLVLNKITKEDFYKILEIFKEKMQGSTSPLVVDEDLIKLVQDAEMKVGLNWEEYERSKVDAERGNQNQIYKTFLKVLDTPKDTGEDYNNSSTYLGDLNSTDEEKILSNVVVLKSYALGGAKKEVQDFVRYYNSRYNMIKNLLINRPDLSNAISINKLEYVKGKVSVIGLVMDKSVTKNGNTLIILEDPTGHINCIVSKNKQNLSSVISDIVFDEVIGITGDYSNNFLFVDNIYYPEIPVNNNLKKCDDEVYVAFISDIHVGSQKFLKNEFRTFIEWLNGNFGNNAQKDIARKIKYLLIIGDTVAGVGVYPNQDEELEITDIKEQYKELAKYLRDVRSDIKIVMCPGNHDATRVAEPQPPPQKEYAQGLYEIENLLLVTNPCLVNIHSSENFDGFNILMYHGASFHYYIDNVDRLRQAKARDNPSLLLKFLLQKRHLAPSHGSTLLIPDVDNDFLVIDKIPDIVVSGDMHRSDVSKYNNVTIINCSCWESKTDFQEKTGNNPDPCKVPIINLKTREIKIMRFDKA